MSDFNELHRMLDDLAGDPPYPLGRKEAVMSRISRRLQRQAAVRGVAGFAVVAVLGYGAVTTTQHLNNTGNDGAEQTVVIEPSREATPTHEPRHEPTHAPSPAAVEPTHATEPKPEPAHTTKTEPTHVPVVTEPTHSAPNPENTAASGPLTVEVSMSPATVDTATDTHALVTARDGEGRLLAVDITWGDGKTFHFSPPDAACPRTTHLDGSFNHRYASPGTYPVHVTVTSGDCAATEKVTRETHVTVTGTEPTPSASTNGPAAPVASGATRSGDNAEYVYITASGKDADGWVRSIVVHWGDGAESSYPYGTSGCTNADGTSHPVSNQQTSSVPGGHHYASAGEKTITVTTTSSACDGSGVQTDSSTFAVTAP